MKFLDDELKEVADQAVEDVEKISEWWVTCGHRVSPRTLIYGFMASLHKQMSEMEPDESVVRDAVETSIQEIPEFLAKIANGEEVPGIWVDEPPKPYRDVLN